MNRRWEDVCVSDGDKPQLGGHMGEGEGMMISHGSGQGSPTDAVRLMEQTLQKEGVLGSVEPDPDVPGEEGMLRLS